MDELTICGKVFSLNEDIERTKNIDNKILKLEKAINNWKKRNLTLEGRILVAKTFAMSQVIYMMQNTFFPKQTIKLIESKIYKYIWKGPDQVKRNILMQTFDKGGLKAPAPQHINDVLKLKQVLRINQSSHPISTILGTKVNLSQPFTQLRSEDPFTQQGLNIYNLIGKNTIREVISDLPDNPLNDENTFKTSKKQKIRIGNFNIPNVAHITQMNPIEKAYLTNCTKNLMIDNLAQLYEAAQTEISTTYPIISQTINRLHPRLILLNEGGLLNPVNNETLEEKQDRSRSRSASQMSTNSGFLFNQPRLILAPDQVVC